MMFRNALVSMAVSMACVVPAWAQSAPPGTPKVSEPNVLLLLAAGVGVAVALNKFKKK